RVAVEGHVGQVVLQPQGLLATILGDLVGRVGVVQREDRRVGRGPLQHRLRVDALAFEVLVGVTHVVRHGIQLADRRRILDYRVRAEAAVRTGPAGHVPGVLGGLGRAAVTLLVAGIHAHAPGLVRVGVAEDTRHFRGDVAAEDLRIVGHRLDSAAGDDLATAVVQRTRGQDVDRGADAAAGVGSAAGLVHGHAADGFGSELGKVEATGTGTDAADLEAAAAETIGTRDLAAVEGDQIETRAEATRGD